MDAPKKNPKPDDPPPPSDDILRAPSPDDPDVDESSSVNDLVKYGHHALTQDGLATRIGYLWRRRAYKSLYLLKQKPKSGRQKGDFADLAESLGYSRSQGYKLAHLWKIIASVDAWAEIKADQSKRRRNGIEEWPSDEAILIEFP